MWRSQDERRRSSFLLLLLVLSLVLAAAHAKVGVLVVGLSGNNGATLAASLEAARQRAHLEWETPQGPVRAEEVAELGCISQLSSGPCGEWLGPCRVGRMEDMVLGGWDVRRAKVGDALYDSRVLPHDLVRQLRSRLNRIAVWPGVFDRSFVGPNQHAAATHTLPAVDSQQEGEEGEEGEEEGRRQRQRRQSFQMRDVRRSQLETIRRDIRRFQRTHRTEHTTVIWSATVERPSAFAPDTARQLLRAFYDDDEDSDDTDDGSDDGSDGLCPDVSPSLIYATAAALEGCSFVNGGSQNTLCSGLLELADRWAMSEASEGGSPGGAEEGRRRPAFVVGTDFKAGQTKFKTAALEYVRSNGMRPKVLASSNHLGNNDMRSLLCPATVKAKLRVKEGIFGPWGLDGGGEEDGSDEATADRYRHSKSGLDHKVKVSYTDFIGDEKRDIVEYTALGLLGSPWTMLTYTRAMDSVLCVPLMVDAAAWCAAFSRASLSPSAASRAMAYLFKVPEGAALGQDPGFFHQMGELKKALRAIAEAPSSEGERKEQEQKQQQPQPQPQQRGEEEEAEAEERGWAGDEELPGAIACAGLACLDMQLLGIQGRKGSGKEEGGGDGESVDESIRPFGAMVTCAGGAAPQAAAALARLGVRGCCIARVGDDSNGRELRRLLREAGAAPSSECFVEDPLATSVAVVPIFESGSRGCFVELGANDRLSPTDVLSALRGASSSAASGALPAPHRRIAALHFGYPHLLPCFCGGGAARGALETFLREAPKAAAASSSSPSSSPSPSSSSGLLVSLDLNGVAGERAASCLGRALRLVDVLHVNEEEARLLLEPLSQPNESGDGDSSACSDGFCRRVADWAHSRGVAVLLLTLGAKGCFVSVTSDASRLRKTAAAAAHNHHSQEATAALLDDQVGGGGGGGGGASSSSSSSSSSGSGSSGGGGGVPWFGAPGASVRLPAHALGPSATANANGAGDTFCAAFVAAMLWRRRPTLGTDLGTALALEQAAAVASLAALHRVDSSLRDRRPTASLRDLVAIATSGAPPPSAHAPEASSASALQLQTSETETETERRAGGGEK